MSPLSVSSRLPHSVWAHAQGVSTEHALLFWNHLWFCTLLLPPRCLQHFSSKLSMFQCLFITSFKAGPMFWCFHSLKWWQTAMRCLQPNAAAVSFHTTNRKRFGMNLNQFLVCKYRNLLYIYPNSNRTESKDALLLQFWLNIAAKAAPLQLTRLLP